MLQRFRSGKPTETMLRLSICVLFSFALLISLFLAYYSLRYSYYSPTDYQVRIYPVRDNVFLNLLFWGIIVLICMLLDSLFARFGEKQKTVGYIFLGICCILYAAVCLIWVEQVPYYPHGDQLKATAAAYYNLDNNFVMFKKTGYLGKFPYQKGLTFYYEILFTLFGDFCYGVAAKIHIIYGILTMIFGYLFVEETSFHSICKILYCPLLLFCAPFVILTPYTYGDLPSICFSTILCFAVLRFSRTLRFRYVVLSCFMAAASLLMRMHTWILLIAVVIALFLVALQKKIFAPILAGILILTSSFLAPKLLDYSYALRSGYEITEGAPMILSLAMGLGDNYLGPGVYNDYQTRTLSQVDYDNDAAALIAGKDIEDRLQAFREDPAYAKWFFRTKLTMQWTEPTFETLIAAHSFDENKEVPEWVEQVFSGFYHDKLVRMADRYMSMVYLGFFCFLPVFWQRRKETFAANVPLIAIVGGFLFSIVWESQCRYVLPYYIFMLMYVPDGLYFAVTCIRKGITKIKRNSRPFT